jgi:hypothetical protein
MTLGSDVLVLSLMIHAPRHVEWPSDSAWTGCGGESKMSKVKEIALKKMCLLSKNDKTDCSINQHQQIALSRFSWRRLCQFMPIHISYFPNSKEQPNGKSARLDRPIVLTTIMAMKFTPPSHLIPFLCDTDT